MRPRQQTGKSIGSETIGGDHPALRHNVAQTKAEFTVSSVREN